MKKSSGKPRLNILSRIAILFVVALLVTYIFTFFLIRLCYIRYAADEAKEMAQNAAFAAVDIIGSSDDVIEMKNDPELRERVHEYFRDICIRSDLRYMYLYVVDEDEKIHYLVCAAADDEDDRKMNEEYGTFGAVSERPLYDVEIDVLEEDMDGDYQFVNNRYGSVCMYVIPILGSDGSIEALLGVDYSMYKIRKMALHNLRHSLLIGLITLSFTYLLSLLFIRHSVIRPINELSHRMKRFVEDRNSTVSARNKSSYFEDEMTDIEDSFDKMAEDISGFVLDIEGLTREKTQNQTQLDIARNIQEGMVPAEQCYFSKDVEIYGYAQPAKKVGGDFYEVIPLDENMLSIVIGDISGKGVSAALFMSMVKTLIKENILAGRGLAESLRRANRELCFSNPEGMFATVFAAIYDTETGVLSYANAGHNSPILIKSGARWMDMDSGMALGLFEDVEIEDAEIRLDSGDGIILYTDGMTDAVDKDNNQFGEEAFLECVREKLSGTGGFLGATPLVKGILSTVWDFSKDSEQFDDMTCVSLVRHRDNDESGVIRPEIPSFSIIREYILGALGDSENTRSIIMACEEVFDNIAMYSNADKVSFACYRTGEGYTVSFRDNGVPFDPVDHAVKKKKFEELDTGGMGIMLARKYSQKMYYERRGDRNVLIMWFDLPKGE